MDSDQYEELCRLFIAEKTNLHTDDIKSVSIPNAKRPGLPGHKHQIDLCWESSDSIAVYLNIADAKWRGTAKVDLGEILLLQQVRQQVAAHKAFMITNVGFTAGAIAAAKDHGIALHVVAPTFDTSGLPRSDRRAIQEALRDRASQLVGSLYSHHVEHRSLGFGGRAATASSTPGTSATTRSERYETRIMSVPSQRISEPMSNRSMGGGETRGGFNPGSGARDEGGFAKR